MRRAAPIPRLLVVLGLAGAASAVGKVVAAIRRAEPRFTWASLQGVDLGSPAAYEIRLVLHTAGRSDASTTVVFEVAERR